MTTSVRWSGAWDSPAAKRSDYAPPIADRGLREGQRLRLSPSQSRNISETFVSFVSFVVSTTPSTIVTPTTGTRLRLLRIHASNYPNIVGSVLNELYFATGATIETTPSKAVDAWTMSGSTAEFSRTWTRGEGPRGLKDELLSFRVNSAVAGGTVKLVIEYTEEK